MTRSSTDSGASHASLTARSPTPSRLAPSPSRSLSLSLSITVPDAASFLPPPSRPSSSRSRHWADAVSTAADSDSEAEGGREVARPGPRHEAATTGLEARYHRSSSMFERFVDDPDDTEPPSTPVTLPPASLASSSAPPSPAFADPDDETASPRTSFPSSDEGISIGLGVGEAAISTRERQHERRSIDNMRHRALTGGLRGEALEGTPNLDGDEQEGWKKSALHADVAADRADGAASDEPAVGGSGLRLRSTSIPFPIYESSPSPPSPSYELPGRLDQDLPPLPQPPTSPTARSLRPSTASTSASSNSSTLSLPTVPPVDLTLPNHQRSGLGTFMSVASGPMAHFQAERPPTVMTRSASARGPRSFLTNLLSRTPRSPNPGSSYLSSSPSPSATFGPRSPSAPEGLQSPGIGHPGIASAQRQVHHRSTSLPYEAASARSSTDRVVSSPAPSPVPRSSSAPWDEPPPESALRAVPPPAPSPLANSPSLPSSFAPFMSSTPPTSSASAPTPPTAGPPPTLSSIGLSLVPLTQPLSTSRNSQPLCGALLDDKYILIGTTGGLDFLPIPLPGSLPMRTHGKKRRETRKPIPLIKRTRFKELAVLSERSNILLAIAGRNDHIRVYALDGIRAMIEKKMAEIDLRDGYPIIPDPKLLATPTPPNGKGKARAEVPLPPPPSTSPAHSTFPAPTTAQPSSDSPFHFPTTSPPPDYAVAAPAPVRRRPPPLTTASMGNYGQYPLPSPVRPPPSPIRASTRISAGPGNLVRAIPTNPRPSASSRAAGVIPPSPRTLRGQRSREFVTGRRGSTAIITKRKSRNDLSGDTTSASAASRRSSVHSIEGRLSRRGSESAAPSITGVAYRRNGSLGPTLAVPSAAPSSVEADDVEDGGDEAEVARRYPAMTRTSARRQSTSSTGDSGWTTDPSNSPVLGRTPRMEPRPATACPKMSGSTSFDLADFFRTTGPGESTGSAPSTVPFTARSSRSASNGSAWTQETQNAGRVRHLPRAPTIANRDDSGQSSTLELADFIRNGFPEREAQNGPPALQPPKRTRRAASPSDSPTLRGSLGPDDASSFHYEHYTSTTHLLGDETPQLDSRSRSPSPVQARSQLLPRPATMQRPGAHERSPILDLADTIRNTGPDDWEGSTIAPARTELRSNGAKGKAVARPATAQGSYYPHDSSNNAGGPLQRSVSARARLSPRPAMTGRLVDGADDEYEELEDGERVPRRQGSGMSFADVIRDGPPPGFGSPPLLPSLPSSASAPGMLNAPPSPNNRASKRWTMSGMGQKFLSRPSTEGSPTLPSAGSRRGSAETRRSSLQCDPNAEPSTSAVESVPVIAPSAPQPQRTSTPLPPHDFKRPATALAQDTPTLPASSQLPPEAHPANSNSPLEYVKLARTKGARLLRAVETKKRTYLAVLCGDEGERIELFTGSRSISLSLNRTFVLPENPRTIEFQIQGDDLIDIYLVYPESIFALEPATVRVREVGVGRGERRARRERERRLRDIASTSTAAEAGEMSDPPPASTLHPADPALTERRDEDSIGELDGLLNPAGLELGSRSTSPSPSPSPAPRTPATEEPPPIRPARPTTSDPSYTPRTPYTPRSPEAARRRPATSQPTRSTDGADPAPPVPPRTKMVLPYSTFQQLPFVPPVPSSVLASAWIIPPLYTDVIGSPTPGASSLQPAITITGSLTESGHTEEEVPPAQLNYPLLSPISLLGGAAHRANGPPGLFFVCRSRNLSGIVTGDGRSVIKKPLVWSLDKPADGDAGVDVIRRIEMLIVGGTKTVILGVGNSEVKAIAVGGGAGEAPFGTAVALTPTPGSAKTSDPRDVVFLGTHAASNQMFFTERVGQASWRAWCVGTRD